jgi:hypothetical protein
VSSLVISTLEEHANAIFQVEVQEVGKAVSYVEGVEVRMGNHGQGPGQSNGNYGLGKWQQLQDRSLFLSIVINS